MIAPPRPHHLILSPSPQPMCLTFALESLRAELFPKLLHALAQALDEVVAAGGAEGAHLRFQLPEVRCLQLRRLWGGGARADVLCYVMHGVGREGSAYWQSVLTGKRREDGGYGAGARKQSRGVREGTKEEARRA